MSTVILSSDLAFRDFLVRVRPRHEQVIWSESHLIAHLYDEETDRLRPFARGAQGARTKKKRHPDRYHFTVRQLQIARESLERTERKVNEQRITA